MSGGGPDAFVLTAYEPGKALSAVNDSFAACEPLFTNVESVMRAGVFMPLDDLIAESEYLKLEDHSEVIS